MQLPASKSGRDHDKTALVTDARPGRRLADATGWVHAHGGKLGHPGNAGSITARTREETLQSHRIGHLAVLALLALPTHAGAQIASPPSPTPEVLRVARIDDTGEGSLRWAIECNNAAPGRYRIEIDPAGQAPHLIKPASALPPIKGPVQIEGAAWKRTGEFIAIDGSGFIEDKGMQTCPGAVPGQYGANVRTTTNPGLALIDTAGVDISGLEIRNFCIGVLIHRSSGNVIRDNRIVGNRGGAGVMLTGDDGNGNPTATTTLHNKIVRNEFVDNGDGLELTRGAAFNLVADNVFRATSNGLEPSQGIEILLGHDNVLVRNRFEGYSDGVQVNGGNRNYIGANVFTDNALGLSLSGSGNIIDGNTIFGNAVGVAVRPAAVMTAARITRNSIYGNGQVIERCWAGGSCDPQLRKGGIVFGVPAAEHERYVGKRGGGVIIDPARLAKICPDGAPDCQGPPNGGIAAPVLDSVSKSGADLIVRGRMQAAASSRFTIEIFGNRQAGGTEGEMYLGDGVATSDASGQASFSLTMDGSRLAAIPASFTATITSSDGATSEFSQPVALSQ
jgi:3-dehydroshikimate dehydratase